MTAKYDSQTIEKVKDIFSEYLEKNTKISSKVEIDKETNTFKLDIKREVEYLSLIDLEQKIIEELSK